MQMQIQIQIHIMCSSHQLELPYADARGSPLRRLPQKTCFFCLFFYFAGCLNKHDRCAEEKALHSPIPRFVWLDNVWFYIYIFIVKYVKMNILFPGCCHRMEMLWKAMISSLISTCHYSHIMEIKYFLWKSKWFLNSDWGVQTLLLSFLVPSQDFLLNLTEWLSSTAAILRCDILWVLGQWVMFSDQMLPILFPQILILVLSGISC